MKKQVKDQTGSGCVLEGGEGRLQELQPRQLAEQMALKLATGELDLEVIEARDLNGLGEGRVGCEQCGDFEVCLPLLGLFEVLSPGVV